VRLLSLLMLTVYGLALQGCDKDKPTLKGLREDVFDLTPEMSRESQEKVQINHGMSRASWPMASGSPGHDSPSAQFNGTPVLKWQSKNGSSFSQGYLLNGPIVGENTIFSVDGQNTVTAHRLDDGELLWSQSVIEGQQDVQPFGGGLAYENGTLFVTTPASQIVALCAKSGKILGRHHTSAPIRSSPTIFEGKIYGITINNQIEVLDSRTGRLLWIHRGTSETAGLLGGASPAVSNGIVISPYSSGEVFGLQQANGQVLWSESLITDNFLDPVSTLSHIKARPIFHEGQVYLMSYGGRIACLESRTGMVIWSRDIGGIRTPVLSGNTLFVLSHQNSLLALDKKTGKVRWIKVLKSYKEDQNKSLVWSGMALAGKNLVLGNSQGQGILVDSEKGEIVNGFTLPGPTLLSPILVDGHIIFQSENGILSVYSSK
jgi:outer membrane protein assembly factor BamB